MLFDSDNMFSSSWISKVAQNVECLYLTSTADQYTNANTSYNALILLKLKQDRLFLIYTKFDSSTMSGLQFAKERFSILCNRSNVNEKLGNFVEAAEDAQAACDIADCNLILQLKYTEEAIRLYTIDGHCIAKVMTLVTKMRGIMTAIQIENDHLLLSSKHISGECLLFNHEEVDSSTTRAHTACSEREIHELIRVVDYIIRHRFDFYSPGYWCSISSLEFDCAEPDEIQSLYAFEISFFRNHPKYFNVSECGSKIQLVCLAAIPPDNKSTHFNGSFRCHNCEHTWSNGFATCHDWQQCKHCDTKIYAYELKTHY